MWFPFLNYPFKYFNSVVIFWIVDVYNIKYLTEKKLLIIQSD